MTRRSLRRRQVLGATTVLAGASGCLGRLRLDDSTPDWDWPTVGATPANTWRAPSASPPLQWLATAGEWDVGGTPRVVARGDIAVLAGETLLALDGAFDSRWRRDDPDEPEWMACGLGPERLYAHRRDGRLHAVDPASGDEHWTVDLGKPWARLMPTDDALFVLASDPTTGARSPRLEDRSDAAAVATRLAPTDASEGWSRSIASVGRAALGPDHLVAVDHDALVGLDRSTGDVVWRYESDRRVVGRPTVADGTVVVGTEVGRESGTFGRVIGVDASTGERVWFANGVEPDSTYLPRDGRVYVVEADSLLSFDLQDGSRRVHRRPVAGGWLLACGTGVFATSGSVRAARSPCDGQVEAHRLEAEVAEPALVGQGLLVPRADGVVERLALDPAVRTVVGDVIDAGSDRALLVAPDGAPIVEPERLVTTVGTTVHVGWGTDWGGLEVVAQPEDAEWTPNGADRAAGDAVERTFDVPGRYRVAARSGERTAEATVVVEAPGRFRHVTVGAHDDYVFDPATLRVRPGTTVRWDWHADGHGVYPGSTPEGVSWDGHTEPVEAPFTYEHTLETPGRYSYRSSERWRRHEGGVVLVDTE